MSQSFMRFTSDIEKEYKDSGGIYEFSANNPEGFIRSVKCKICGRYVRLYPHDVVREGKPTLTLWSIGKCACQRQNNVKARKCLVKSVKPTNMKRSKDNSIDDRFTDVEARVHCQKWLRDSNRELHPNAKRDLTLCPNCLVPLSNCVCRPSTIDSIGLNDKKQWYDAWTAYYALMGFHPRLQIEWAFAYMMLWSYHNEERNI